MSLLQDPPTMENDPPTWELVDPTWELVDPTWELVLTPRWKQTRVIRITKGESTMIHRMNKEQCDHCGRIVDEDKIDEYGVCKNCYHDTGEVEQGEQDDY